MTRIALGSCADQKDPQPIWNTILNQDPDLFLFLGDNVYGAVYYDEEGRFRLSDGDPELLASAYAKMAEKPEFANFREHVEIIPAWDDHDYGLNDGGASYVYKADSEKQFLDFWQVPADDPRRQREGTYSAKTFGPEGKRVQVITLDTRYFRTDLTKPEVQPDKLGRYIGSTDPNQNMLGDAQWAWFEAKLKEPADIRIIISSIQLIADGHRWEAWKALPQEKERFYNLLRSTKANGVVVVSGDRHIGGIYKYDENMPYPLYELTSSSLNRSFGSKGEPGPYRIGDIFAPENFGMIELNWDAGTLALRLQDIDGNVVLEQTVNQADLSAR